MKHLISKICAGALTAIMTAGIICGNASAVSKSGTFSSATNPKVKFDFTISYTQPSTTVAYGTATVSNTNSPRIYYPSIYVSATLYGKGSENSTASQTFSYASEGTVTASRAASDTTGGVYGNFRAYGNSEYGEVSGSLRM